MSDNEIFKVLDAGYVTLIDHMGDDLNPLEAARMSTGNKTGVEVTKDDALRDRLWRDKHSSPFEMNVASFELQVPLFVLRQIDRHRTVNIDAGVTYENYDEFRKYTSRNEFSGRYAVMPDLYYIPEVERIQPQSKTNKQGSEGEMTPEDRTDLHTIIDLHTKHARMQYNDLVTCGLSNELARMVLPQNQYTRIRIQAAMSNWFKFLAERLPETAQWETRQYAKVIGRELRRLWPKCWEVFEEHTLYSKTFSRHERLAILNTLEDRLEGRGSITAALHKSMTDMGYSVARADALVKALWPLDGDEVDLLRD
jgi:thymidylate synthase (FAD)